MISNQSLQLPTCDWRPESGAAADLAAIDFDVDGASVFDVPLPWLGGDWRAEHWRTDARTEYLQVGEWQVHRSGDVAFAAIDVAEDRLCSPGDLETSALAVYRQLFALRSELGLGHLQRVWHWLHDIIGGDGEAQRYRSLCRGRARTVDEINTEGDTVLPPATCVASARPGLRIQALLGANPITPIENPRQISAYNYPREHGRRAPAFARAAVTRLGANRFLLISGTASIIGHRTRHVDDIRRQTRESVANIEAVISAAPQEAATHGLAGLAGVRGYIAEAGHADIVLDELRALLPGVPVTLLQARLCRPDLGVEIEAQMRL